jgi:hypothetical protein
MPPIGTEGPGPTVVGAGITTRRQFLRAILPLIWPGIVVPGMWAVLLVMPRPVMTVTRALWIG